MKDRFLRPASPLQRDPEVVVRSRKIRLDPHCLLVMLDRILDLALQQ